MDVSNLIATRYLQASRENRFFSWISILTIAGIAIGVAALIVVLSVINGFEKELRERFLAANAHILAYRFPSGLENYQAWEESLRKDFGEELTGVAPFVHFDTMARKDYLMHGVLVKGVHPRLRQGVQPLRDIIRPADALDQLQKEIDAPAAVSEPTPPGIILGVGLLSAMQAQVGDRIELISPNPNAAGENFGELRAFRVVGVYDSGLQHYDTKLGIVSLSAAQQLFHLQGTVTGLEIGLKDPDRSVALAERMRHQYHLSLKEWQSYNQNLFEAMRSERNVIALIVALVAFVASFNILTTLFVSVTQRQRDISILKALGANHRLILWIFCKQSLLIGLIGSSCGVVLASLIASLLQRYPFIDLPDIYLLATLPAAYEAKVYGSVACGSLAIALLAGLYPAWLASRISPVQGLYAGRGGNEVAELASRSLKHPLKKTTSRLAAVFARQLGKLF